MNSEEKQIGICDHYFKMAITSRGIRTQAMCTGGNSPIQYTNYLIMSMTIQGANQTYVTGESTLKQTLAFLHSNHYTSKSLII